MPLFYLLISGIEFEDMFPRIPDALDALRGNRLWKRAKRQENLVNMSQTFGGLLSEQTNQTTQDLTKINRSAQMRWTYKDLV